jgi:hypothetical protein
MTRPISKLFLVIDALDECIDTRSEVLDALKDLHISQEENIRVLYTSRNEVDIQHALTAFTEVPIEAKSVDLELYVASEIQARIQPGQLRITDPIKGRDNGATRKRSTRNVSGLHLLLSFLGSSTNDLTLGFDGLRAS